MNAILRVGLVAAMPGLADRARREGLKGWVGATVGGKQHAQTELGGGEGGVEVE